ncbi:MAG: radical SAM protein [Euryarchaeota archaeon]|nr:radical SAM protein [Euryarchaeota archaeon]
MPFILKLARKISEKCTNCGICENYVKCSVGNLFNEASCIGCGACSLACPSNAVSMIEDQSERKKITITINNKEVKVPERITVKAALELEGFKFTRFPTAEKFFSPCEVGGCWSCSVLVNGNLSPACTTQILDGMIIETKLPADYQPKRVVSDFMAHYVGGVGTPHRLKRAERPIEVVGFTHGCTLRCPQCQNHVITFTGGEALAPIQVAEELTKLRREHKVDRMTLSGGECTLNRPWLIQVIKETMRLNTDENAHFHVDTNGSILTKDYVDELVQAGMTDIGIDLKGIRIETFMKITNVFEKKLANIYLKNAWSATKYILDNYSEKIFLGVGVPHNKAFITLEEIREIGSKLARWDSKVQVTALDYRAEFKRTDLIQPSPQEMLKVGNIFKECGLKTVMVQSRAGHFLL